MRFLHPTPGLSGIPQEDAEARSREILQRARIYGEDRTLTDQMMLTRLDSVVNWGRKNSLWPFIFGTACCAIEFMAVAASHFDISRFGAELIRWSPRQADMMIVGGTVSYKQAPILRRIYQQMADPKWVIAMGACAASGGFYDDYCTVQGVDKIIPVDLYIAGCPPRPEAILGAIRELQIRLERQPVRV
ncbi:MAG: NADH-quinone oxidoreductase subunit B [Candidatus Eisenbacteria bacterium]|uniref:NADH-quinone oxidoreductase subunit B n=1 Tax=Eiseniibacteriota bacterium TaxID=2212470 RepID=A0A948S320_UNCEI|nr:NADH-quinone oxidoreductase subunit B [Candidatus Eisenbacteria bacterium]MBU1950300.1 NADH-quinone oxidoreductase subunit B [Candidatus Eisenbacteria bacterium]MBU2692884.1 NADH-quinone oxidoreductase subunit B [Candidatus Eisenbacteria bacterium]